MYQHGHGITIVSGLSPTQPVVSGLTAPPPRDGGGRKAKFPAGLRRF